MYSDVCSHIKSFHDNYSNSNSRPILCSIFFLNNWIVLGSDHQNNQTWLRSWPIKETDHNTERCSAGGVRTGLCTLTIFIKTSPSRASFKFIHISVLNYNLFLRSLICSVCSPDDSGALWRMAIWPLEGTHIGEGLENWDTDSRVQILVPQGMTNMKSTQKYIQHHRTE